MPFDAVAVRVMIASPSDVEDACLAVERAIHDWNREHSLARRFVFVPWRWKEDATPSLSAPAQAVINAQGVDQSDLIVALFGSRLGAPTAGGASGTIEEIERARSQGKPVYLYFSNRPHPPNVDAQQLLELRSFRQQIEDQDRGLFGQFDSLNDLRTDISQALTAFSDGMALSRASNYLDSGTDRVHQEITILWKYRRNEDHPETWDAATEQTRRFTVNTGHSVPNFTISLARDSDASPQFGTHGLPTYILHDDVQRSSTGGATLMAPVKQRGSAFAQVIEFTPPLLSGDSVFLSYSGEIPGYKYAARDSIVAASAGTKLGLRDWDFNSFIINHPCEVFTYSVFLPDELGASPLGPRVDYNSVPKSELTQDVIKRGYSQSREVMDGQEGWLMSMRVEEPAMKHTYRLMWRPGAA